MAAEALGGSSRLLRYLDLPGRFHLPRFVYGLTNPMVAMLLIVPGWLLAQWTVGVQFFLGKGTPIPLVPTRRLVVRWAIYLLS